MNDVGLQPFNAGLAGGHVGLFDLDFVFQVMVIQPSHDLLGCDLVPLVHEIFEEQMRGKINQRSVMREDVDGKYTDADITNIGVPGGTITEAGLRLNIDVGLQYINSWLLGNGAAAIYNLMEDAATAEISRSQIWQWIHNKAKLDDGRTITRALYAQFRDEELVKNGGPTTGRFADAVEIMDKLVLTDEFPEFLTLIAYDYLD